MAHARRRLDRAPGVWGFRSKLALRRLDEAEAALLYEAVWTARTTATKPSGATGAKMLDRAAEIADGAILNLFLPVEYARAARDRLGSLEAPQLVGAAVSPKGEEARTVTRQFVIMYLGGQPHIARELGLDPELIDHRRQGRRREYSGQLSRPQRRVGRRWRELPAGRPADGERRQIMNAFAPLGG